MRGFPREGDRSLAVELVLASSMMVATEGFNQGTCHVWVCLGLGKSGDSREWLPEEYVNGRKRGLEALETNPDR